MTTETKSRAFADQDALLSTTKGIAGLVDAMFVIDEAHVADKVKERAMYGVCNAIRSEISALTEAVELKHVVVA